MSIGIVYARTLLALDTTDSDGTFRSTDEQNLKTMMIVNVQNHMMIGVCQKAKNNLDRHCQMLPTRMPLSIKAPTFLTWPYKYHYKPNSPEFEHIFSVNNNKK